MVNCIIIFLCVSSSLCRLDGDALWSNKDVVSEAEILQVLQPYYSVQVIEQQHEPARQYLINGSYHLGIISTITHSFCRQCDRIRINCTR